MPPVISFLLLSCLVLIGLSAEGFNRYEDDVDQQEQAQGEEEELSLEQQWLPIINQGTVQWRFSIIGSLVLNFFFLSTMASYNRIGHQVHDFPS